MKEPGDHFRDECGVFGVHGHSEAANITYLGLYALQHRGQESCGIVSTTGRGHFVHRAMGLVSPEEFHPPGVPYRFQRTAKNARRSLRRLRLIDPVPVRRSTQGVWR